MNRNTRQQTKIHQKATVGQVRIIGGDWRGRKLPVRVQAGLRPTSDRIRETLFNWLQFEIAGARCLDAFAGSGALGFEALSRGARHVVFVEKSKDVACQLIDNGHWLKAEKVQVFNADTQAWLAQAVNEPFDIVFMDPPFNQGLVEPTLAKLLENDWLSNQAWLVVEQEKSLAWSSLLTEFELYREKTTAQTRIGLWRRQAKEE